MEDQFMTLLREEPRPEFKRNLKRRLSLAEGTRTPAAPRRFVNARLAMAGLAGVLVVTLIVSPAAQALAQEFLNLFRVRRITAVSVSPEVMSQMRDSRLDIRAALDGQVEVLQQPPDPQVVGSLAEAGQLAGIPVFAPARVPEDLSGPEIVVHGGGVERVSADVARIQTVLETLGAQDITLPAGVERLSVTISRPPVVALVYQRVPDRSAGGVVFMQSRSPEIALPPGVELAALGELALRLFGMSPDEARQMARSIDWNSTLLLPIPADMATFREVQVRGATGLLVLATGSHASTVTVGDHQVGQFAMLLWSEGDRVYAAAGDIDAMTLVDMADSMQ